MPALAHGNGAPDIPMVSVTRPRRDGCRQQAVPAPRRGLIYDSKRDSYPGITGVTTASDMPIHAEPCRFDRGTVIAGASLFRIAWLPWRKSAPA
jgi:hypothetical protein